MATVITLLSFFVYVFIGSCVGAYRWEKWERTDRPFLEEDRFMGSVIMGAIWPLTITVMSARHLVKTVLLGLLAVFFLSSCGSEIKAGTIVDKSYDDPDEWIYMAPIPHESCSMQYDSYSRSTRQSCTTYYTYIPVPMHDGPHWFVKIEANCRTDDKGKKKCDHATKEVSESTWNSTKFGDWYGPTPTVPAR